MFRKRYQRDYSPRERKIMNLKRKLTRLKRDVLSKRFETEEEYFSGIKECLRVLFKIKYEFTPEELMHEIGRSRIKRETKVKLIEFVKRMELMEYGSRNIEKEKVAHLIDELKEIIGEM